MLKTKIRIFIVSVIVLLSVYILPAYASAALNVSDPSSFIEEKYDDYLYIPPVGFASKEHYFVMGAPANVKIEFFGSGVYALRLFVENSYGSRMGATNPYNKNDFKTLDLNLKPGRYKISIVGQGAYSNTFLFYMVVIDHPQPAPIIESLIPANGSIVSRIVKLGVYPNNDMAENPLISSVDVLIDNNLVETIMFPPFEHNWDTSLWSNQYHAIEFRAYDILGRYYPSNISVKVENSEIQTSTDSFHDSIVPFWGLMPGPYKEYSFEMARDGLVNIMLSGEDVGFLEFLIYDKDGNKVANSKGWPYKDNPKNLDLFLKAGKYFIRVRQRWHTSSADKLIYSLTVNHPSANLSILKNLNVTPETIDSSGDSEIEPITFSYDLLEDAYALIKLTDFNKNLIKLIQPISFQSAGIYNTPNIWNGLLENEKISDEGIYFFVIELYDKDNNFLEKQSVSVEIKYHLGY